MRPVPHGSIGVRRVGSGPVYRLSNVAGLVGVRTGGFQMSQLGPDPVNSFSQLAGRVGFSKFPGSAWLGSTPLKPVAGPRDPTRPDRTQRGVT